MFKFNKDKVDIQKILKKVIAGLVVGLMVFSVLVGLLYPLFVS